MSKIRVVIIHNEVDSSAEYANRLNERLTDEAVVVGVNDPRPIRLALPIRTVPNVAVILFADTLEEGQDIEGILRQLELIKNLDEVSEVVATMAAAGTLPAGLQSMAVQISPKTKDK